MYRQPLKGWCLGAWAETSASAIESLEEQFSSLPRPGGILEPPWSHSSPPRELETSTIPFSEDKKTCLLQHQVLSNFLPRTTSQEKNKGFLWREAALS